MNPTVFGNFERYWRTCFGKKPKGKFIQIMDRQDASAQDERFIEAEALPISFATLEQAAKER